MKLNSKFDNRTVWHTKTVATMGQINLSSRVHNSSKRPGYNRHKENRSWKKDLA